MPLSRRRAGDGPLVLGAAVLTAFIFSLDVVLPLGATPGMLYVFVILLGFWISAPIFPAAAAAVATVLLMVDTVIGWTDTPPPTVIFFNRPLMTLIFWVTAALVIRYVRIERRSEDQIRQLADLKYAIDQAAIVATTDVKGRITYVNDKFCEISKYPREELLGQDHRIINSGAHPKEFFRDLWQTIARGEVWHGEILNKAKDGSPYWVDTTIVPFVDARHRPYQYTAIRADITARKRAEEKLRHQAALARVGQMAAVVAHEVRNPLAGIKGAMQVLASRRAAGDPEASIMGDMVGRIDSLSELINDLLLFAGPAPPRLMPVTVGPLLEQAAEMARRDPAGEHVEIRIAGASDDAIEADPELLKGLFVNLFLNAAQAMSGHAAQAMSGHAAQAMSGHAAQATPGAGRIDVTVRTDPSDVTVAVRDYGPGIPEEIGSQIFEPFFTTKSRGGGLGLAIARRTAELHDGSLEWRRPQDGGAEMVVTLARRPLSASAAAVPAAASGAGE